MARAATTTDAFNAISERRRRDILDLLSVGGRHAVGELVTKLRIPQSVVSNHLAVLREVGLVTVVRQGKRRFYTVAAPQLKPVHDWVKPYQRLWEPQAVDEAAEAQGQQPTRRQPCIAPLTELNILDSKLSRFFPYVFFELKRFFKAAGYHTRLYTGEQTAQLPFIYNEVYDELMADVAAGKIRGVVNLCAFSPQARGLPSRLAKQKVPLVNDSPAFTHGVFFPYRQWISAAVRHLAANGRRRIGFMAWDIDMAIRRLFRQELEAAGLSYQPEWVRGDLHPNVHGAGWAELREVWTSRREKPDGLLITDDILVPDAAAAINELGLRVPGQLMVVAHANKGSPYNAPLSMTKLEYDTDAHARLIGELMLKLVRGEPVSDPHPTLDPAVALRLITDQVPIPVAEPSRG